MYWPTVQARANCTAYAFNMDFDPFTGKDLSVRHGGGYGMQPGDFGGRTDKEGDVMLTATPDGDETFINIMKRDCAALGLQFVRTSEVTKPPANGYKVILTVREKTDTKSADYHWYRLDANGVWSDKPGSLTANTTSDPYQKAIGNGYYHVVGEFWIME